MKSNVYRILILSMLLFTGVSCVEEPIGESGAFSVPDGKVQLQLFTNADDYKVPTRTGSANETGVGNTPWVIVFQGTDEQAVFSELAQAVVIGTKSYVQLTQNDNPCRILVIANPTATFFNGSSELAFNQANLTAYFQANPIYQNAAQSLLTPRLSQPNQTTVPYAGTTPPLLLIPMSGTLDVASVNSNTTIGTESSKFLLTRVVAKVAVTSTVPDVTLLAATVINAPIAGELYKVGSVLHNNAGTLTDYLTSTTGDGVTGIAAATGNTTAANPIYMYECRKEESPSVIIKTISYGSTYYYRLAFNDNTTGLLDVLRNKYYMFNVTSINDKGYGSAEEAKANPPANIRYTITVTDQLSYDISDNGIYYLGASNSEYILYNSDATPAPHIAFTITTNATQTQTMGMQNTITYTNFTGAPFALLTTSLNLAATAGAVAMTDVFVLMPTASDQLTFGTITVTLGNLSKTISLTCQASISGVTHPYIFTSGYVSGTVISQGTGGASWLSFSSDPNTPGTQALTLPARGDIYLQVSDNVAVSGGVERTGGQVYIERWNSEGRLKIDINQHALNTSEPLPSISGFMPYVGTFHRWNQTGERLIRIPWVTGLEGEWVAEVISGDFIVLDTSPTQDPGVTYNTGNQNPADMNNAANDAAYRVPNTAPTRVFGKLDAIAGRNISFRVGLTSTLSSASAAPRYGVIALTYAKNSRITYIYVRQGEAADYVMRPSDPINSGGTNLPTRDKACKFVPYNLTDPGKSAGFANRGTRGYVFTDYPSKAGYYFQWGGTSAWSPSGTTAPSWNGVSYTGFWQSNPNWETCPTGYRRINDGSAVSNITPGSVSPGISEIRESLWVNPGNSNTQETTYSVGGYYADGYFDRRAVIASATGEVSSTTGSGSEVAYIGRLYFNPTTNASLFFPNAGLRYQFSSGTLTSVGTTGNYWTTAANTNTGTQLQHSLSVSSLTSTSNVTGLPIRCVAN